jgi:hypothetical protein
VGGMVNKTKRQEILQTHCRCEGGPSPHILLFQETNVTPDHQAILDLPLGCVADFNTPVGHMKGVGTLVMPDMPKELLRPGQCASSLCDISEPRYDLQAMQLNKLLVINVYVHVIRGDNVVDVLTSLADEVKPLVDKHKGAVLLAGDMNMPKHRDQELLVEMMEGLGLEPVLPAGGEPLTTHERGNVLDWLFVGGEVLDWDPLEIEPTGGDHSILRATIYLPLDETGEGDEDTMFSERFNYAMLDRMMPEEKEAMWKQMEVAAAEATSYTEFWEMVRITLRDYLGPAKPPPKGLPKAWFNAEVRAARRAFRRCQRAYRRQRTLESQQHMRDARKVYHRVMRRQKRRADVEAGQKSIYRLVPSKKGPAHQRRLRADRDKTIDFWRDLFHAPDPLEEGEENVGEVETMDVSSDQPRFEVDADLVQQAWCRTDFSKAPGPDNVRGKAFPDKPSQQFFDNLARLITLQANTPGPLPDWMRLGNAETLHKKGSRKDPSNYRVIVMGCFLAKLFEKVMELRGREYVESGLLDIFVEQGGFMPKRTTYDSVFILNSLRDAQITRRRILYALFLDLKKAFDTVSHRKFLQLMRDKGAPEEWIRLLQNTMTTRTMTLFKALVHLQVGTPQGSPISPLIFILFINPLIERIRAAGKGVMFTDTGAFIRCLLFADDICLAAESFEDLDGMLKVCQEWADEWGMSFNHNKTEAMQLAGRIPDPRPQILFNGQPVTWKSEFKYLGVIIREGRRAKHPLSVPKLWKAYHRVKRALDPALPIPLMKQLQLIRTDVLGAPLYPAAVRELHYKEIDTFIAKLLCRVTGCPQHETSATFLRVELGFWPSKFTSHERRLYNYWNLRHRAWFRNHLDHLVGQKPLQEVVDLAKEYELDLAKVDGVSKVEWKALVKEAIRDKVVEYMKAQTQERHFPEPEKGMKRRRYIKLGESMAKYGVQFRWSMVREFDARFRVGSKQHVLLRECADCGTIHRTTTTCLEEQIMCPSLVPPQHREHYETTLKAVAQEMAGVTATDTPRRLPSLAAVVTCVKEIQWRHQTKETTIAVLNLFQRLLQVHGRQKARQVTRWGRLVKKMLTARRQAIKEQALGYLRDQPPVE